jgi:uncharacterized protein YjbI with pentapeptide repeats
LREANFRGADLENADFTYSIVIAADLREANLTGADLRWADFREANLENTKFTGARQHLHHMARRL